MQDPIYNTPEYWQAVTDGLISWDQAEKDQARFEARSKRARDAKYNKAPAPSRHERQPPCESKQFAKPMSTRAARDDRLTPQAKALLQVIVARTGKGRTTDTTKTTLGAIMNRCPRSIQRYIGELVKFGYIRTQIIKSRGSGLFVALRIWIMNSVLPFYVKENPLYEPGSWLYRLKKRRNPEETLFSPTNNKDIVLKAMKNEKPPWFDKFAFR